MIIQKIWQKDAREWFHDVMFKVVFKSAYSAFEAASRLDFDWYGFTGCQGRELCQAF